MKKGLIIASIICLSALTACDHNRRTAQNEGYQESDSTDTHVPGNNESIPQPDRNNNENENNKPGE